MVTPASTSFGPLTSQERKGLCAWAELLRWLAQREGTDSLEQMIPVAATFYADLMAGEEFMRRQLNRTP